MYAEVDLSEKSQLLLLSQVAMTHMKAQNMVPIKNFLKMLWTYMVTDALGTIPRSPTLSAEDLTLKPSKQMRCVALAEEVPH